MLLQENKYVNISSTFPNAILLDATGPGLTDGSELVALNQNDGFEPFQQSLMDYADGGVNNPTGSVGVPNSVSEATGVSQMLQAFQRGHAIGPGFRVPWDKPDVPGITGDRVLLLTAAKQGVLVSVYPDLDREVWVTDTPGGTNNAVAAAGGYYYRADDSAGATPNPAGIYLILPPAPIDPYIKQYSEAGGYFAVTSASATWTTETAVIIPYKTSNGIWRAVLNISGGVNATARTTIDIDISNISFSASNPQAIVATSNSAQSINRMFADNSPSNRITFDHASNSTTAYRFSGDLELSAKPTFADDFEFKTGITY